MTARNLIFLRGIVGLALLWGLVFLVVSFARARKPTAEKVTAFQNENRLSEIDDPDDRRQIVEKMATMLNQMEASELNLLSERDDTDPRRDFFREMNSDEQKLFMERRVGRAFEQIMESFNEMDRDERRRIVERSLKQMRENNTGPGVNGLKRRTRKLPRK